MVGLASFITCTTWSSSLKGLASSPDSARIYFSSPDTIDKDDKLRREKKFTVNIRNAETPLASLWTLDLDGKATKRLTEDSSYSVGNFTISALLAPNVVATPPSASTQNFRCCAGSVALRW